MRRKGYAVYAPGQARSLAELGLDAARVVEVLSPLVTDGRLERLREVFAARLSSVTTLMDAPHDPHNGAAIIRTLDAFGVQDLHVVERKEPFLVSATIARGSQKWVDVHTYPRVPPAVVALGRAGFTLVATHPKGRLEPADLGRVGRLCLVLGNERDGISDELLAACGETVRVPMRGFVESLNVSVTAAILLHGAVRGRPGDLGPERRTELLAQGLLTSVEHAAEVLVERGMLPREEPPRRVGSTATILAKPPKFGR